MLLLLLLMLFANSKRDSFGVPFGLRNLAKSCFLTVWCSKHLKPAHAVICPNAVILVVLLLAVQRRIILSFHWLLSAEHGDSQRLKQA